MENVSKVKTIEIVRAEGLTELCGTKNVFTSLLSDGDVEMPQDILDRRNELLIDVKNW